ncbi:MAG: putative selenium-dependent hydroxylase accessory protein YqeC, partial [Pseudomonadota bacterium]
MVCLVGGGGKTSLMFRLAGELAAQGMKILVTTTT